MLPFTKDALFAVVEPYHRAVWPLPLVMAALGFVALALARRPGAMASRLITLYLASAWILVGLLFHLRHFAGINFAAPAYGVIFVLEGLLLAWAGLVRTRLGFALGVDRVGAAGLALALYALLIFPLADRLAGYGWPAVRLAGTTPEPTALLTLGLLLAVPRSAPWHLVAVPLLWSVWAGVMGWWLRLPQDAVMPVMALLTVMLLVIRRRGGGTA